MQDPVEALESETLARPSVPQNNFPATLLILEILLMVICFFGDFFKLKQPFIS